MRRVVLTPRPEPSCYRAGRSGAVEADTTSAWGVPTLVQSAFAADHSGSLAQGWCFSGPTKETSNAEAVQGSRQGRHSGLRPGLDPFFQPKAPEGAPSVLMIVRDDVAYGAMDVFGLMTQPGMLGLSGNGVSLGRGNGSSVSSDYEGPFPFVGGTIERVVIDVSGDHCIDHEKEVLAYLARD
jgi:hypothetical protein